MRSSGEAKPKTVAQQAIGLIAGAAGAVAGFYAGFALLFPAAFALLSGWLLTKAVQPPDKPMLPAGAVQIGHGLWMLLGLILLSQYDSMLIDGSRFIASLNVELSLSCTIST